jgi:23S rRNA (uracil1939-C5)-methyltransferase
VAEIVIDIEHLNTSGDGVARHRGQIITVPFTIPGERVRVSFDRSRRRVATLLEVVRASPHRVQPGCSHFGVCGGCAWQHIAYREQLRLKTELVDRLVKQSVPRAPAARPMIAATPLEDPWHYRQKVHFVFGPPSPGGAGGPGSRASRERALIMGHYARGSRRVMAVRECPVHDQRGNTVAFGLLDAYTKVSGRHGLTTLKSIAIRVSRATHETMVTLVVTDNSDRQLRTATRQALSAAWAPSSFHVNVHPRDDAYIFGRETRRITGTERLRDEVGGATFLMSPTAFFQTNVRAAEILVQLVLDAVPADVPVLDLYAGAGLFALPLAKRGQRVTAVEASHAAVEDGEASLRVSRIPSERCRFVATPVSTFTSAFAIGVGREKLVPAVILDPPREGCEVVVLDHVFGRIRPATAVYVSCNPETLARDLQSIVRQGYAIESMQPVDMFPHTPHIETVVTLTSRRASPTA